MDQDLQELLSAWLSEDVESARREQLLERLRRDQAFRQSFVDEIGLLGMIKVVQATEPRWLRLQDELGWGAGQSAAEEAREEAFMERLCGIAIHPSRRLRRLGAFGLAAAVLLGGLAVALSWMGPRPGPETKKAAPDPPATATATALNPEPGLALVVRLEAILWETGERLAPGEGSILMPGDRFRLRAGRASLSFFSGVTLTLEGPADLELIAMDRVFCHVGKLRARVPHGAEGFVVASPGSAVVDLGTEFALNVEPDGTAQVMVFEGTAEAALLDAAGSPKQTQLVEQSEAFELDPHAGRIAAVARPGGFATPNDRPIPHLELDPDYPAAILASRPSGYWRFESLQGSAVPNEVAGGPPLRVKGPIAVGAGERFAENGCAVFQAGAPAQCFSTDDVWQLAQSPGHALELWFLSDEIRYAAVAGLYPPKDHLKPGRHGRFIHTFMLELTACDRQSLLKPASLRFLHRWPLDTRIGNNLFSDDVYVPRRWHHAVAQKNGPAMELYFDGEPVATLPLDPDHPTVAGRLVVGRRTPDPLETHDSRSFVGRIDELAVYDHPLAPEEVERHYQLAVSKGRHE